MPSTRNRVVCAFGLTIDSFTPVSRFSSVDLPAFGDPTIATNPQREPATGLDPGPATGLDPGPAAGLDPVVMPPGSASRSSAASCSAACFDPAVPTPLACIPP